MSLCTDTTKYYYKTLRLLEEGKGLLKEWTEEKSDLPEDHPKIKIIDHQIKQIKLGNSELENLLAAMERRRLEIVSKEKTYCKTSNFG